MDNLQYLYQKDLTLLKLQSFKPYYKWIIFNIETGEKIITKGKEVLNLIING